ILITILVLELKVPHGDDAAALRPLLPVFLTYVLSFVFLGIYWNNHHHMLHTCGRINGRVLWANLHLLFWLSLVPFVTGWMGENHFAAVPTAVYGAVLLAAGLAYTILQATIIAAEGPGSRLAVPGEGHQHARRRPWIGAQPARDLVAVDPGQANVEEHDLGADLLRRLEARRPVRREVDHVAPALEQRRHHVARVGVVVDHED